MWGRGRRHIALEDSEASGAKFRVGRGREFVVKGCFRSGYLGLFFGSSAHYYLCGIVWKNRVFVVLCKIRSCGAKVCENEKQETVAAWLFSYWPMLVGYC